MDYNSSWGNILNRTLQFRCKICPDGTGEFADIACADAWYGKDGYPDFAERSGRSLIVARTSAGRELLASLEQQNAIVVETVDASEIEKMQPYQANRKRNILARLFALAVSGHKTPKYVGLDLPVLAVRHDFKDQFKNFVGTFRRVFGKKTL